jgi:hypothetical protein
MFEKNKVIRSWQYALFILGVSLCLLGALLMVVGEGILAENHSGIAAVVGISGIGLIARARNRGKKRE